MQAGDAIPVYTQMADYRTDVFPLATVKDETGTEISGSPFTLEAEGDNGFYVFRGATMPEDTSYLTVETVVYDDAEHATRSESEGGDAYKIETSGGSSTSSLPPASNITGVVEGDAPCQDGPIQDILVKGSDRTLTMRLVEANSGNPFSLSGVTEIECRFRNDDGTVLSLKLSDDEVDIVSAAAGRLLCVITDAQSADLAARTPAPFTVIVTKSSGVTVVNLPTQLAIIEADV